MGKTIGTAEEAVTGGRLATTRQLAREIDGLLRPAEDEIPAATEAV